MKPAIYHSNVIVECRCNRGDLLVQIFTRNMAYDDSKQTAINLSSFSLSRESIENAFLKRSRLKDPAKAILENSDIKACEKCEHTNSTAKQMSEHMLVKHSEVKIKCTKCTYQHRFATKVRTHFKFVHMGITQRNLNCKNAQCLRFGTTECTLLEDHILYH